jgi:hypothetical protein
VREVKAYTSPGGEVRLQCSCFFPNRAGIPCRHQFHVLETYYKNYCANQIDVHPFWWTTYLRHSFLRDEEGGRTLLSKTLEEIVGLYDTHPYTGPEPPIGGPILLVEPSRIDPSVFEDLEVKDRVLNWSREEIRKVLPNDINKISEVDGDGQVKTSRPLPGLSQQSFTFSQAEDYSLDSDNDEVTDVTSTWKEKFDDDHSQLRLSSSARVNKDNPYSVLNPIFKMLVAAVEKDSDNLKKTEALLLNLVATVEGNVAKLAVEEEGHLALPTSKRKRVNQKR